MVLARNFRDFVDSADAYDLGIRDFHPSADSFLPLLPVCQR